MMNQIISIASKSFILLSAIALLLVSLMAFVNPQSVMDLVKIKLDNNDAFSSIRGVYGGVGLTMCISLIYLAVKAPIKGLAFLSLLWGFYSLSRITTIFTEGSLGAFGTQWLYIESALFLMALVLLIISKKEGVNLEAI